MPTAQIYRNLSGFQNGSISLKNTPSPYFSIRLKPLESIGVNGNKIIYGDEATPDFLDTLNIVWGNAVPVVVDQLQAGYKYIYNVGHGKLYIYNAAGQLIVTRPIISWSDFKLAASVLESRQFQFFFDASYHDVNSVFIPATRQFKNSHCESPEMLWGEFDNYLQSVYHFSIIRLYTWLVSAKELNGGKGEGGENDVMENLEVQEFKYEGITELRDFIVALVKDLSQDSHFIFNLAPKADEVKSLKQWIDRGGLTTTLGRYLMIYALTCSLMMGNKPCYEPWMIWQMFKWLQKVSIIELDDKIFDLSPRW